MKNMKNMKNMKKRLIAKKPNWRELAFDLIRSLSGRELVMLMKNPKFRESVYKLITNGTANQEK